LSKNKGLTLLANHCTDSIKKVHLFVCIKRQCDGTQQRRKLMHMRSVLLIGNGINLSFSDEKIKVDTLLMGDKNPYKQRVDIPENVYVPFPLKVVIQTRDQVGELMKKTTEDLWGKVRKETDQYFFYKKLLELPCDDILTTNYGFELEEVAHDKEEITDSRINAITEYLPGRNRNKAESSLFLYTYQSAGDKYDRKRIWHIHGHAKNPSSMVIGHGYYGRLLYKIIDYVKDNGDRYRWGKKELPEIRSWIDTFLFGNVYMLGFSCDFAEMDLWWLLDHKKNGQYGVNAGKVFFYEPNQPGNWIKYEMLRSYGVEVCDLGMQIKEDNKNTNNSAISEANNKTYKEFYYAAVESIREKMAKD